jgi:hypothetical protein
VRFAKPFGGPPTIILMGCGTFQVNSVPVPQPFVVDTRKFDARNGELEYICLPPTDETVRSRLITSEYFMPQLIPSGGSGSFTGIYIAVGPKLYKGSGTASYLVLGVVYAPPGASNGAKRSSVAYGNSSTTGTKTSASQSFTFSNAVSVENKGGFIVGINSALSYQGGSTVTDSQSVDIKKTTSARLIVSGSPKDGIDHDYDEIYLWLSPKIDLALSTSSSTWMLEGSNEPPLPVFVGNLNGHYPFKPNDPTLIALQHAGITPDEYQNILKHDPLVKHDPDHPLVDQIVSPGTLPDRYSFVAGFIYKAPLAQGASNDVYTWERTSDITYTRVHEDADTSSVALTLGAESKFTGLAKTTLKDTTKWVWTNKSSNQSSTGTTNSAEITVGGPAPGYAGDILLKMYEDTVYQTYCFELVPYNSEEVAATGIVKDSTGSILKWTEVTLTDQNHVKHHATTNQFGEYAVLGHIDGPFTVAAGTMKKAVAQASRAPITVDLFP